MDWDEALTGVCKGIDPGAPHTSAVNAMWTAVYQLYLTDCAAEEYGGRFVPETIGELEPTWDNGWDYVWPSDFDPDTTHPRSD